MSCLRIVNLLYAVCQQGCASLYFKDAGAPPEVAPQYALDAWPYEEYWTGIVFNGHKIGFTHLRMARDETRPGTFLIRSEAAMHFRFLGIDKQVKLLSRDWVNPDLTINGFVYDYDLDGNRLKLYGVVRNNVLMVVVDSASGRVTETYPLTDRLYPTSVINLYPVFQGLHLEAEYAYQVYDGESQRMTTLTQEIQGYETSDLFSGAAYKVRTSMHGQEITTWINEGAEPLLEMSLNGVFIAGLESEWMAKRYLAQAALNKDENLLNFSLIKTDRPVNLPRETAALDIELEGLGEMAGFPNDTRQQCEMLDELMRCQISGSHTPARDDDLLKDYLASSVAVPAMHPRITDLAGVISVESESDLEKLSAVLGWLKNNVRPQASDVFSALDVLDTRRAECQGYSFLFASLARSMGIPTRIVNGIVYSEEYPGFLYHTWVESLVDGHWQAIDPTFGQLYADATHIKFVEGENLADLTPLLAVIGRLSARILEVDTD